MDVALVLVNIITPICGLWFLVFRTDMNKKIVKWIRHYVSCCMRSFPSTLFPSEQDREEVVAQEVTSTAEDDHHPHGAISMPSTIFQFHHPHRPSYTKVYIAPTSEKSFASIEMSASASNTTIYVKAISEKYESIETSASALNLPSLLTSSKSPDEALTTEDVRFSSVKTVLI